MIWKYINRYKWRYLLAILILLAVDVMNLYVPQLTGEITNGLKEGAFGAREIRDYVLGILALGAGITLSRFGWRYFLFKSSRQIEYEIRNDLFEHLTKLSSGYFNEHKTGDLMAHFTSDISAIRMAIGPAVMTAFDAIVMTGLVIIKMIRYVNLKLTLLACIPMLFIMIGAIWYGYVMDKLFTKKQEAFSRLTDEVQESISGIRVIKAFVQEKKELKAFTKTNKYNMDMNLRVIKVTTVIMPLLDYVIGIASVITLLYGGYLVVEGQINLGQFVAFNQYIGMLVWPMLAAGDSINFFSQGKASIRRIKNILDEKPEIVDEADVRDIDGLHGEIELNNLSFRYLEGLPEVLRDVSVKIERGQTLAILGKTGSGKTTIANLLLRMYNTAPGMISFDGHDIREIPLKILHQQIAYVPQDNFLFSDTIQSNIAFGVRDWIESPEEKRNIRIFRSKSEMLEDMLENDMTNMANGTDKAYGDIEQVTEAAKKACIHDNIIEFPGKYQTMVGERGVTMSGGQKQRSSIARALMKDAPILILDDALSAVDTDTEEHILNNLKRDREGKTTIIIAHRISTIQHADKILILDEGRKAEYGSHEELLRLGGIYAGLYERQQLEKLIEAD